MRIEFNRGEGVESLDDLEKISLRLDEHDSGRILYSKKDDHFMKIRKLEKEEIEWLNIFKDDI